MLIEVYPDSARLTRGVASRLAAVVTGGEGRVTLGLAGGGTPAPVYRALAAMGLDWGQTDLWLSDERWVPPDDERSNGRMVDETLAGPVGARLHRPPWNPDLEASDAAAHYESVIRSLHHDHRPDLVHLGLGADGHTASLFPGTPALETDWRWVVDNPGPGEMRITTAFPLLWRARVLVVQVTGGEKAEAVRETMEGRTPASRLADGDAEVEWHLDREAAALIS
ncbi:MAG: 6-phosphogluconolactonase [Actinobacteria bacterium]|nr:6-phosphogluconolactonase [Actinomycetota bacterium]